MMNMHTQIIINNATGDQRITGGIQNMKYTIYNLLQLTVNFSILPCFVIHL
jgi:hypothetical protein